MRVGRGEGAAAALCIDRFGPLVWFLASRLMLNKAEAEDAVQDIFMALWKSAHRFDPKVASARAFVAIVARRRLIDRGRAEQVRVRGVTGLEAVTATAKDPSHRLLDEDAERVMEAMDQLKPEQRDAIRLSLGEGWTHQRIAEHMSVPLGTVKTNIRRGLIRLRQLVNADGPTLAGEVAS